MTSQSRSIRQSFWNGKRVFVTGASGMVGSWLVKNLLESDAFAVVLVHDADPQSELFRSGSVARTSVVNGSIEDFAALQRAISEHEIDTVFHLGAQTIVGTANRHPLPTFEANIRGTYNLLEACRVNRETVRRVVIASSDKAYGTQTQLPYTEAMPLDGRHPYDVSKSCADLLGQSYHHTYGLPVAIARCGNVYGGGDLNWSRIVPGTIRSIAFGEPPLIRTDGAFVRDYIYVKDVARAYLTLAEQMNDDRVAGGAFNFSCESPVTVLGIVRSIQELMNASHIQPDIRNSVTSGEIRSQSLSAEKARNILRWQPEFDLKAGLRETIDWYRTFLFENNREKGAL